MAGTQTRATRIVFVHLPGDCNAVPAGRLTMLEEGPSGLASRFAYGRRYLRRDNAIAIDPLSLSFADAQREGERLPVNGLLMFGATGDAAPRWSPTSYRMRLRWPGCSRWESITLAALTVLVRVQWGALPDKLVVGQTVRVSASVSRQFQPTSGWLGDAPAASVMIDVPDAATARADAGATASASFVVPPPRAGRTLGISLSAGGCGVDTRRVFVYRPIDE